MAHNPLVASGIKLKKRIFTPATEYTLLLRCDPQIRFVLFGATEAHDRNHVVRKGGMTEERRRRRDPS